MESSTLAPRLKEEQVTLDHHELLQDGGHGAETRGSGLSNLELSLGISPDNGLRRSGSPWLGVAVHPWSLAARQEKAAMEHAHLQRPNDCTVQRETRPAPPPLVGWPPVRTFRKNLSTPKPSDGDDCDKLKSATDCDGDATDVGDARTTMFVKVNLEGYAVGRKIDLKAHLSYDSLSRALQSMFISFLSDDHGKIATREDEQVEKCPKNYILLYEDNEGDRMLVGDVPWELFISSVKRLYIAHDPRVQNNNNG